MQCNALGQTPLYLALLKGHTKVAQLLKDKGDASVNCVGKVRCHLT